MKRALPILIAIVILFSTGTVGCGVKSTITGKYINEDNPQEYLILHKDGEFSSNVGGEVFRGEWEATNSTLFLYSGDFTEEGEITRNRIIFEDITFRKQ